MTTLSVIIPCYDVAPYVPDLLASLRRNVDRRVEFVLVDDGSTDQTGELLAEGVRTVPGARVVAADRNRGLSAARNLGLAESTGDFLSYLDGDDFVAPGYYGELLDTIVDLGCDMLRTDHVQVTGRKRTVHRISHGPRGVVSSPREAILPADRPSSVDAPYAPAGAFSRRVADQGLLAFDETLRTCEDRAWCWRLHLQVESFAVVGLTGLFYRRGVATSLTQLSDASQLDFFTAYDQIMDQVRADHEADRFATKAVRSYCSMICHHLGLDRYAPALRQRIRTRGSEVLRGFDAGVLESVLSRLDAPRRSTLLGLWSAA